MTYFTALKLSREPFSTSPDPSLFYRSQEHYTALNRLEIAIRLRRGLSVVLGDVGTGKTTLSRALLQSFIGEEDQYLFHLILNPAFKSEEQFLSHLTNLFGLRAPLGVAMDHRDAIEKYLFQKCVEEHKTVVLIIDEGQKLTEPYLEILRTLLNYETNDYKMLQLVIFAQMELLDQIKAMRNFMDRISLKYLLNPLDEYETQKLIEHRLKETGHPVENNLFSYEAIKKIHTYTQGYPRQITRLCHQAMESLAMESHEKVTAEMIDEIIKNDNVWNLKGSE